MARTADGEEFSRALKDAEEECLKEIHGLCSWIFVGS